MYYIQRQGAKDVSTNCIHIYGTQKEYEDDILLGIVPCSLEVNLRLEVVYCFHHQGDEKCS